MAGSEAAAAVWPSVGDEVRRVQTSLLAVQRALSAVLDTDTRVHQWRRTVAIELQRELSAASSSSSAHAHAHAHAHAQAAAHAAAHASASLSGSVTMAMTHTHATAAAAARVLVAVAEELSQAAERIVAAQLAVEATLAPALPAPNAHAHAHAQAHAQAHAHAQADAPMAAATLTATPGARDAARAPLTLSGAHSSAASPSPAMLNGSGASGSWQRAAAREEVGAGAARQASAHAAQPLAASLGAPSASAGLVPLASPGAAADDPLSLLGSGVHSAPATSVAPAAPAITSIVDTGVAGPPRRDVGSGPSRRAPAAPLPQDTGSPGGASLERRAGTGETAATVVAAAAAADKQPRVTFRERESFVGASADASAHADRAVDAGVGRWPATLSDLRVDSLLDTSQAAAVPPAAKPSVSSADATYGLPMPAAPPLPRSVTALLRSLNAR